MAAWLQSLMARLRRGFLDEPRGRGRRDDSPGPVPPGRPARQSEATDDETASKSSRTEHLPRLEHMRRGSSWLADPYRKDCEGLSDLGEQLRQDIGLRDTRPGRPRSLRD